MSGYRQMTRRKVPSLPQGSEAPYLSYWKQPTNQPLRNRTPRRQQPIEIENFWQDNMPTTSTPLVSKWIHPVNQPYSRKSKEIDISNGALSSITEPPYLSYWYRPTNQPLKNRIPKRQQPPVPWTPPIFETLNYPLVSEWKHPTDQPLRNRIRRPQQPNSYQYPGPPRGSQAPYLSYWKQPVNEPLKNRIRPRQQPQYYGNFYADNTVITPPLVSQWYQTPNNPTRRKIHGLDIDGSFVSSITEAPYISYWIKPTNQPKITKKRYQPPVTPVFWADNQPISSILVSQWNKPTNQPVRGKKRQQPQQQGQFWADIYPYLSVPLESWHQTTQEPRIVRKRQQPMQPNKPNQPITSFISPTNQPLKNKRRPQQPVITEVFWADIQPINNILLSQWNKPVNQPTKSKKRQQPAITDVFWADNMPTNTILPSQWYKPTNQPVRGKKRQQPQSYGQFWGTIYPHLPVNLESFNRVKEQPRTTRKRQQPMITDVFWADNMPTSSIPFVSQWKRSSDANFRISKKRQLINKAQTPYRPLNSWMRTINQPIRNKYNKRQQPITYGAFWIQADQLYKVPFLSSWKAVTSQPLKRSYVKRQQPQTYGNFWADIYPHLKIPLESWKQPINQPLRYRRPNMRYITLYQLLSLAYLVTKHVITSPIYMQQNPTTSYMSQNPDINFGSENDDNIYLSQQ